MYARWPLKSRGLFATLRSQSWRGNQTLWIYGGHWLSLSGIAMIYSRLHLTTINRFVRRHALQWTPVARRQITFVRNHRSKYWHWLAPAQTIWTTKWALGNYGNSLTICENNISMFWKCVQINKCVLSHLVFNPSQNENAMNELS